ncbi:MAG: nitronate monooxygenase family protein [Dysgonamonadaceae bacterium]|jgi:NAD(P)H-dependent flavin oxidoreductase YrpB (nitropropane dioxygenase family)|nr:nitronate monooxygenase family protein [Dysgonamonadaceae bacterium]MDD4400101.1 nitronate monooxygenase family protein [Dysgonamonadaceae bacterium]
MKPLYIGSLQIKLPIIQGGMGVGISLSGLASAVANEGGVGVISSAGLGLLYRQKPADFLKDCIWGLKEELRKAREKSSGFIGVNIMSALTNFSDMVHTAIQENVDFLFVGAGLPLDLPSYLVPGSKTKLVPIVSSSRAAKIICEKWKKNYDYLPDAMVVEGPKAGGHLGFKKEQIEDENFRLEKIVPEVVQVTEQYKDIKSIPVIAAGGIYSGQDIYQFVKLGAAGVQMGTIFVTSEECDAPYEFKKTYIDSKQEDILIIQSPVGMPGRAIRNEYINKIESGTEEPVSCPLHCIKTCDYQKSPYCIMKALFNASRGNMKRGYAFAGSNAYLAKKILSVKEIIATLKTEYEIAELNKV